MEDASSISILAARLSVKIKIPMADSIIYASAKTYDAIVWTQDSDFENLECVRYFKKANLAGWQSGKFSNFFLKELINFKNTIIK